MIGGSAGRASLYARLDRPTRSALVVLGGIGAVSLLAPALPLPTPEQTQLDQRLLLPLSDGHLLGTDHLGRDLLARLLSGTRLSLLVALFGVSVAAALGSGIGLLSGYYGGRVDGLLMRLIDLLMAFPYLLLALAIVAALGPGLEHAAIAIAVVNVPFFARAVRGQTLSLEREAFVDAARLMGMSDARILWSEMLPGLLSTIVVAASTSMGWMILETAGLSFLGLGAQPPTADLGGMLGQGRHLLTIAPHVSLLPGVVVFCIVALFNVVGDGLRDALDPQTQNDEQSVPKETPHPAPGGAAAVTGGSGRDAPHGPAALLEVRELCVHFGAVPVVRQISFCVQSGERVALVGESGSGKSVTSLALMGLLDASGRSSRGAIVFDGRPLDERRDWDRIRGGGMAWIPQDPMTSLHPLRSVGCQLCEVLWLQRGLRGDAARRQTLKLMHQVGIPEPETRLRAFPHQLSGGMRQRVVIAMALASEPRLMIADEPTTALDVTTQQSVLETLRRSCDDRGMALLFISHDLAVVSQLCDRILVMTHGRIVEQGTIADVIGRPRQDYTRQLIASVPCLGQPERILGRGSAS